MKIETQHGQADEPCGVQVERFDESVELDDAKPFINWVPSPDQIERWARQIREERGHPENFSSNDLLAFK